MSREFGSYSRGYFHYQIETAAADCAEGDDELTRLWGAVLNAFAPVANAISSSEANDAGAYLPIMRTLQCMPAIKDALRDIDAYCSPFAEIAGAAVSQALQAKADEEDPLRKA
jgi:hypothetical protein